MHNFSENNLVDQSSPEPLVLIKPDSPYFTIVNFNDAFIAVSQLQDIDIIGKSITELHKWNSDNEESALLIHDLLNEVILKKEIITLPAVRYDLTALPGEQVQASWWQAIYEPFLAEDGSVEFILCITRNITAQMQNESD
ncbi:MAG: PAS domain-containing protein [Janthinobacterium lividum]